ncbi:MAG: hypothetical protein H6Q86_5726 [candidate division NC10 bacterium]|nr:hypothetical protein [candidate division NC10 bacterium]
MDASTINIIMIVLGVLMLFAGAKLFALVVGGLGFVLAGRGKKAGVWLGGFGGGGLALTGLLASLGVSFPGARWIPFVIGGIVGAILFAKVFTVALVFISSLAGATVLTNTLFAEEGTGSLLFFALAAVGILVQGRKVFFGKKEREKD